MDSLMFFAIAIPVALALLIVMCLDLWETWHGGFSMFDPPGVIYARLMLISLAEIDRIEELKGRGHG